MKFRVIFAFLIIPFWHYSQSRIISFTSLTLKDSVKLNFTISQGPSCGGYQVLKGSDSTSLSPISIYGGLCGNSNYPESYVYYDISPNRSSSNYYRIMIPPGDYSRIIRVDMGSANSNILVFPQPAESILNIALINQKNFNYEIKFVDRFGKQIGNTTGYCSDKISINVESFPLGIYIFRLIDQSGNLYSGKFSKI